MRNIVILGAALTASFLVFNCGSDSVTCDESGTCAPTSGEGGPTIDGQAGDGPIAPDGCVVDADPKDSPKCVDDSFGVFVDVAKGADTNAGTKASPLKSIGDALGKLSGKTRIYVATGTYAEHVQLTSAVSLYGGFTSSWSYDASKAKIAPADRGYGLQITAIKNPIVVADLEIISVDGADPGESSIAAFVSDSSNVAFRRITATAGKGVDALAADAAPNNLFGGDLTGTTGSGGVGGAAKPCACLVYGSSTGGAGGNGGVAATKDGKSGTDGSAAPTVPPPSGAFNGKGGPGAADPGGACSAGTSGASGQARAAGSAAQVSGVASATVWKGASGGDGEAGGAAQGGGGGGGDNFSTTGGGGGGGGCGGCGGGGGRGGVAGGSSITLLLSSSTASLDSCVLSASDAGRGGNGSQGAAGGAGGAGGGAAGGCQGRLGGNGAGGGGGAGGAGGVSAGVVRAGGSLNGTPTGTHGKKGDPGTGGGGGAGGMSGIGTAPAGAQAPNGLDGQAGDVIVIM